MTTRIDRLGEQKVNKWGSLMTIVEYNNAKDIVVEFKNGYRVKCEYIRFKKGNIESVYNKTVCNIGYIGEGKYATHINGNKTMQYNCWRNMLMRCYDEKILEKYPTYIECSVCEEWHNFQSFAKWFDDNYYEVGDDKMCLDKDILCKGNKIYSPNKCIFVPNRINVLLTKSDSKRGKFPIGVSKKGNGFQCRCSVINEDFKKISKYLGTFNTPEEAFYKYKGFKEDYIKKVANEYKDKIPYKLYKAMCSYIVEIND